jgi:hypothetical protein
MYVCVPNIELFTALCHVKSGKICFRQELLGFFKDMTNMVMAFWHPKHAI